MNLCQPYYIEKRKEKTHVSLNGKWDFCWTESVQEDIRNLSYKYQGTIPSSVYNLLYETSVLPDPYVGENSKQYQWVDEKIWYFRKKFNIKNSNFKGNAYLCFDGISYYSRIWINGTLLGEHEGMFGGPCCDIREYLNSDGENEIIVEVKSANYGKKEDYDFQNLKGENTAIIPWNIIRDSNTSNGDFVVLGIWNEVRIELLPELHISRPYMYTKDINQNKANIHFEIQIADGSIQELQEYYGATGGCYDYTRAFDTGLSGAVHERFVEIEIKICDKYNCVYYSKEEIPLTDFAELGMDERYLENQFYQKEIVLNEPKLWYPNGMGEPFLYDVTVIILSDGMVLDTQSFKFGVRTFSATFTHGNKYRTRWDKYLFSVNGKEFFLKGMNWTPIDFLYNISRDKYEWCLTMVKNAGIQLLRVWNGGGMPETDIFYELCDRLGIMVWQDQYIANTTSTKNYPQNVLECQTAYNLYRIRNHASLVVLCGGNEFNPYTPGNAASMFVIQRTVETLAPDRVFYYTTADKGSAHIYIDMEPVWYRHRYKQLPFLAESGIHSFPQYKTLKKFIKREETIGIINDLSAPEFRKEYPELLNHFTEYRPDRVPRLMSRISQIISLNGVQLSDICDASQVQAYEFYQLMIQSMQENYPVCGGVMPWVFKRPWPTIAIQTVDGDDRPGYAYYSVLNSYKSVNICWCQQWSVLAPGEEIPLTVKVFNQNNEDLSDTQITLTIFNPDMTIFKQFESNYQPVCDYGKIKLTEQFTDTCFLICANISRNGVSLSRSVYFNKCTNALIDREIYKKYRNSPAENLYFKNGPWLKSSIENAKKAVLEAKVIKRGFDGRYNFACISVKNISDIAAYPITVDLVDDAKRCFLSENFFMIMPFEEKEINITCDEGEVEDIKIQLWNGKSLVIN